MSETKDNDNDLFGSFDARKWAERFVLSVTAKPTIATDEGTMLAWFAGAIMAGYDHAKREREPEAPEIVVLPRDALFEFFGEMALPPWRDERGRSIGGRIECAPIAERITRWVNTHDLTDVLLPSPRVGGDRDE